MAGFVHHFGYDSSVWCPSGPGPLHQGTVHGYRRQRVQLRCELAHELTKFTDFSTALEVPGYHRALSLVSLHGDGSQQLWQLSDSTSICVSDACSASVQSQSQFDKLTTASGSQRTSRRRRGGWNSDRRRRWSGAHHRSARRRPRYQILVIIVIVIGFVVGWSASDLLLILYCNYCDCDFTAFRNRCIGVVPRTLSDIGCHNFREVTGIRSIEWLMNCSYFCITNHMFCCDVRVCSLSDYVKWTHDDVGTSTLAITRPSSSSSQPYSFERWPSCQWLCDVCVSSWTGRSRQPGVIVIYVYILRCTVSAVVKYMLM